MSTMTFTVGLPGSGKSTYADKHYEHALRLEHDKFREAMFGDRKVYWKLIETNPDLRRLIGPTMFRAMTMSMTYDIFQDVILSSTNLKWDSVKNFHKLARDFGMKIEVVYFDLTWDELMKRNETRGPGKAVAMDFMEQAWTTFTGAGERRWWHDPLKVDSLIRVNALGEKL